MSGGAGEESDESMPRQSSSGPCADEVLAFRVAALDTVLEALGDGVIVVDDKGSLLYGNRAALQLLPIDKFAAPPEQWPTQYHLYLPDGSALLPAEQLPVVKALRGETAGPTEVLLLAPGAGPRRWISMVACPLPELKGRRRAALALLHDVTEVRSVERALRRQRDWLSAIMDTVGSLIVVLDREGCIVSFNRACELATGYRAEEVLGTPVWERLVPPEEVERFRAVLQRLREGGQLSQHEGSLLTRNGQKRLIVWSNTVLRDAQGNVEYLVATGIDVTERRRLEEQLRQAQKMEALGRLAGGIAHDFNNLITVIYGYAQMLRDELPAGSPWRAPVEECLQAASTASELATHLLAFTRQQPSRPRQVDLNQVVTGMERMLRRLIGEDIELVTALHPQPALVRADPVQLEQVIMNLVVNAREAMPRGGRIVIETAEVNLDEEYLKRHLGARLGPHVLLAVSDTGTGMPPEVLRQAFDPFFTTKEKGTGLGLSTVYGIVQQHGGQVWAYSEPGYGTTFKVYLPAGGVETEPVEVTATEEARAPAGKTILVVEDEPHLRKLIGEILVREGYAPLVAEDPADALRICRQYRGKIDLLLSDVVMPQMSGRELAARVRAERPEIPVLFMSGYADWNVVYNGLLEAGVTFLQKPFTKASLLRKIGEALKKN